MERVAEVGKVVWDQLGEMKRDYFVQVRADPDWDPMVSVRLLSPEVRRCNAEGTVVL